MTTSQVSRLALVQALLCAVTFGCTNVDADVGLRAPAEVRLGLSDPGLVDATASFLVLAVDRAQLPAGEDGCTALVNASTDVWASDALVAAQVVDNDDVATHTFGALGTEGPHAFLVLGSTLANNDANFPRRPTPQQTVEDALGSVIAVGCQEVDVAFHSRVQTNVVVFPAGRR